MATTPAYQESCDNVPKKIGIVLFPTFEAIDVAGPLDSFQWLSTYYPELKLCLLSNTLDPVTTKFSATSSPNGPSTNFGWSMVPTHTFDKAPEDIDVLFVPGGLGVFAVGEEGEKRLGPIRCFIKDRFPKVKYLLTVCTGSGLVAQTGVLDGYNATSNKASWAWVIQQSDKVKWQPVARWTVDGENDKIWTSSGVSAGMDMALAWIGHVYSTPKTGDLAAAIAKSQEYVRNTDPHCDPFGVK